MNDNAAYFAFFKRLAGPGWDAPAETPAGAPSGPWLPYVALGLVPGGMLGGWLVGHLSTPYNGSPNFYTFAFNTALATAGFELVAAVLAVVALVHCKRLGLTGRSLPVIAGRVALGLSAPFMLLLCVGAVLAAIIAVGVMLG